MIKKLSIILICALVALTACTKSKEVHPEIGDGNDEIVTVGMKDVHVEYTRTDHAKLNRVVFHYCPADANGNAQQFMTAEMTKKETFFELTLNDLLSDTLYWYYYELFPNNGDVFTTIQKTFHTQANEQPGPPTPPVAELPTVVTGEVTGITAHSASCGGEVTSDGGAEVTERGICWSTSATPTISDSHIAAGTGTGAFTAVMDSLQANTTYHVRAYATNEAGTAYGLDREFVTDDGGCDCGYVDLDLPSGLLWATCNVGANSPEEYGDYFAWGETQPKDVYDYSTYQYSNGGTSWLNPNLIKYCSYSGYGYNGFTDNLTELLTEDDAATANWGADWRMPTKEDWEELCNNTTSIMTTQNGKNGRLFSSSNGNTLFLPAAGSFNLNHGLDGSYWSSSLFTDRPIKAWGFYFRMDDFYDMGDLGREGGFSVRPVRSSRQN